MKTLEYHIMHIKASFIIQTPVGYSTAPTISSFLPGSCHILVHVQMLRYLLLYSLHWLKTLHIITNLTSPSHIITNLTSPSHIITNLTSPSHIITNLTSPLTVILSKLDCTFKYELCNMYYLWPEDIFWVIFLEISNFHRNVALTRFRCQNIA